MRQRLKTISPSVFVPELGFHWDKSMSGALWKFHGQLLCSVLTSFFLGAGLVTLKPNNFFYDAHLMLKRKYSFSCVYLRYGFRGVLIVQT